MITSNLGHGLTRFLGCFFFGVFFFGFLWKWFPNHESSGGPEDNRFTPQRKPAALLIKKWYGQWE